jgi:hypothetical protein
MMQQDREEMQETAMTGAAGTMAAVLLVGQSVLPLVA